MRNLSKLIFTATLITPLFFSTVAYANIGGENGEV